LALLFLAWRNQQSPKYGHEPGRASSHRQRAHSFLVCGFWRCCLGQGGPVFVSGGLSQKEIRQKDIEKIFSYDLHITGAAYILSQKGVSLKSIKT
jgi:hypothetical protein